ncbi:hypothetical protein SARC_07855, partial [Sphaeroforma arctica JP610]
MENQDDCVNAKIVKRLDLTAPSEKLKFAYLEMIAESHGVAWYASLIISDDVTEIVFLKM